MTAPNTRVAVGCSRHGSRASHPTPAMPAGPPHSRRATSWPASFPDRAGRRTSPLLFTVVGDSGHGGPVAKAIARRIRAAHPAFLIHVGDFAYKHGTARRWRAFLPAVRPTLRRVPLFPTPGNHDLIAEHLP